MGVVIDTCVFVRFERTRRAVPFADFGPLDQSFVSAVTVSELMVGVHFANSDDRRAYRQTMVDTVLDHLAVLDFTASTAPFHSQAVAHLRRKGTMIGAHDAIIAGTALQHGHSVLTLNFGEFERVPGLTVIRWTK
jgi:tRNA(fMet)-specific endonuclease VapC